MQMLEYEMATNAEKLKSIVDQGKEMAAAGHFDSASILKAVQDFDKRLDSVEWLMVFFRMVLEGMILIKNEG